MNFMRNILLLVFVLLSWAPSADAHHLWIVKGDDAFVVARGLVPDRLDAYHPAAVRTIRALDRHGKDIAVQQTHEKDRVIFQTAASPSLATVRCDWGPRVNTTQGKKLMSREAAEAQGLRVIASFLSTQYSKTLFADSAAVCRPVGMKFELIPMKSPFHVASGDPLLLRLLFDGRPLADAVVFSGQDGQTTTDARGMARMVISGKGLQVIAARHKVPDLDDPQINYHKYMTFIIFEVK